MLGERRQATPIDAQIEKSGRKSHGRELVPMRAIEFERIKGGKTFDTTLPWFTELLRDLGQD